ncbi:MAG: hypothetical protein L3J69_16630 [Desulfobacula sp.]|nr:hypothetical protein [Desulfobacula sp.]
MDKKIHIVTSPVMGIFYKASSPVEKSLVETGQKINTSDIVCMIESMKIFTELRSEKSGIVKKILVENEEPVMKNQALIEIEVN